MSDAGVQSRGIATQSPRRMVGPRRVILALAIIFLLAPAIAWFARPASVLDLSVGNRLARSGLAESWARGDVIVLLRHAERCDRSKRTCLGPSNGITLHGSAIATQLGSVFSGLGLANADVLSSTTLRTQQTAQFVFGQPALTQEWLFKCTGDVLGKAMAQKNTQRNLVLVTHSECFDRLEQQLGISDTTDNPYASTLFVQIGGEGARPKILGFMHARKWLTLAALDRS
ncbi:histidine phosphatase family protein [Pseudomonas sp. HR96]|uniref:lipopolysaccharide core heptose(II)-phosphate phosphatase PmrG n=1 Tax=Pseudomonas sp. HR96 TaxID=1027966 RepID=UPI002A76632A|nr:histidine phosphatase family protein [Pseudomonas sp. HR96]WPO98071.1 histidine phosphatase family protein [Pseudomonas sp. HR96]